MPGTWSLREHYAFFDNPLLAVLLVYHDRTPWQFHPGHRIDEPLLFCGTKWPARPNCRQNNNTPSRPDGGVTILLGRTMGNLHRKSA